MNASSSKKVPFGICAAVAAVITICALAPSCEHYVLPELSIYPDTLYFPAAGGAQDIDINCNVIWRRADHAGWIDMSCDGTEGSCRSTVTVEENTERARRATVPIETETIRRNLIIIQEGPDPDAID